MIGKLCMNIDPRLKSQLMTKMAVEGFDNFSEFVRKILRDYLNKGGKE